jgi:putative ABC transport system substrate-binding protein
LNGVSLLGDLSGLSPSSSTIPIVFASGDEPIKYGLVDSINRPEGNVTGVAVFAGIL